MNPVNNFQLAQAAHNEYQTGYGQSFTQSDVVETSDRTNGSARLLTVLTVLATSAVFFMGWLV